MMDPDYDLFMAIAESSSLSAAARRLKLSPASLSKRLQRLEARLGVRLMHRTTRRLSLTAQGEDFHRDLTAINAALGEAEARVSGSAQAIAGSLRMTAPTSFGRLYLGPCLAAFAAAYPGVDLEVDLSDGFVDLMEGRYQLAVRITDRPGAAFASCRLATSRRVLCAAPAYLDRHGAPTAIAQLGAHRLLAADGQLPWLLSGPEGDVIQKGESAIRTNSSDMVRELALAGAGIALRSLWDVSDDLDAGRLVRILPDHEGSRQAAIHLVHMPAPRLSPVVRAMIAHLQAHLPGLVPAGTPL